MNRIEFRRRILAENDAAAALLREQFASSGTLVVDLVSSPGSGKTSLLEATARMLGRRHRLSALVGDIATELDADRLRTSGLRAHQIVTGGACHLDARLVTDGLAATDLLPADVLFIENVGNLVCPASYALGEDFKVVLLSVTEGDDKPFKYPAIFSRAAVSVITKMDLLPHVGFDLERARNQIKSLNPDARILTVSTTTGRGMQEWCELLTQRLTAKRSAVREVPPPAAFRSAPVAPIAFGTPTTREAPSLS
jgi:hydrogenase nickel incorporation protein HypB